MAELFQRDRSVVVKHIRNIYATCELDPGATCAESAQVARDGKTRLMDLHNLDVFIGIGYRVNSRRGTEFRIWATNTLRDHIIKGYEVNQRRLTEQSERYRELQEAVALVGDVLHQNELETSHAEGLLRVVNGSRALDAAERDYHR